MPKYRYIGPGPIEVISGGELIRPLDEREFEEEPAWGPWELIEEAGHAEAEGAAGSGSEAAAEGDAGSAAPAAAASASAPAPAAPVILSAPITPKGF